MTRVQAPLTLAVVGFGAIGEALARALLGDDRVRLAQVVVSPASLDAAQAACAALALDVRVASTLDLGPGQRPDLVVECAGHAAVLAHVLPALRAGIPCAMASVGALHDAELFAQLEAAAQEGGARLQLVSGAIGAIDALAAARFGGLDEVTYVGRKPPLSWTGTPAEQAFDLARLASPQVIFRGSAREAARQFPKNANVAATVSLAGLGLDRTQVELVADPGVTRNVHAVIARGAFGRLELQMENLPLAANPKTSALTVYSLVRAVRNAAVGIAI
ncbi:aspartate dehydrogenase [Acidovorax soli]|uniref:L-aspartate dehydrogenase n=1 Tax=Acidovorax soli TaxID=592050 RepID=A0A7X0PFD8_9BURK|nr:aspartate dehydrogenase [Acidovorax soli]MBB6560754.1 aspartate dehydrogenase [Acidovorax soli]